MHRIFTGYRAMKLMKNKWFIFALMWFGLIVYGLLRESPPNGVSLFPHFDKVAHFLLFFCQTWLLARAFFGSENTCAVYEIMGHYADIGIGNRMRPSHFYQHASCRFLGRCSRYVWHKHRFIICTKSI